MHNSMDPSSPTTAEQGLAGQANVPVPPSTTSSHSGRQADGAQLPFGNVLPGFQGMPNVFNLGQSNPGLNRQSFQPGGQSFEQGCVGNQQGLNFQQGFQNAGSSGCGNPCYVTSGPYGCGQGPSWSNGMPGICGQGTAGCQSGAYGPCPSLPVSGTYGRNLNSGFVGNPQNLPGGVTPQASNVRQIVDLLQTLDGNQTRVLQQILSERMAVQSRGNPEFFGEMPRSSGEPFVPDWSQNVWNEASFPQDREKDVFSRTEKWLAPAPTPAVEAWKSREQEILGWNEYLSHLIAWASQASETFATEIQQASKWHTMISLNTLSVQQRSRASRLFAILKAAFSSHARTSMLISVFSEGLSLQDHSGALVSVGQSNSNGFELVRQLSAEFSLRSRGEACAHLAAKSFVLQSSETSVGTVVTDTIRKLDYECSRFSRLLSTLPPHVDATGLALPEADVLLMLLRSLPNQVRDFCLHHAAGDSLSSYRTAAKRWEEQQRMFHEIGGNAGSSGKRSMMQLANQNSSHETEYFQIGDQTEGDFDVNALGDSGKCMKCGSRKHMSSECTVDLTKTKCFRCSGYGHVSMNCPQAKQSFSGKGQGGKNSGGKGSKGKGKPSKGGRKGKLYEMTDDSEDWWWYSEWNQDYDEWYVNQVNEWDDSEWQDGWNEQREEQPAAPEKPDEGNGPPVGSLVLSPVFVDCDLEFQNETCFVLEENVFDSNVFYEGCGRCESERDEESPVSGQRFGDLGNPGELSLRSCEVDSCPQPFHEHMFVRNVELEVDSCPQPFSVVNHASDLRCGLKCQLDADMLHEGNLDGLTCEQPMRVEIVKLNVGTFMNHVDELSHDCELERWAPIMMPLLSQVDLQDDVGWWLLDSGAAVTVLAKHCVSCYAANVSSEPQSARFSAANGSDVKMHGKADVSVFINLVNDKTNEDLWKKAKLVALIGETKHNILSTTSLSQSGWIFSQRDGQACLVHEASGARAKEVVSFSGCAWVRLHPHSGIDTCHEELSFAATLHESGPLFPLSKKAKQELEQHRNQGHTPHNPNCLECARGRGTFQHRRRVGDTIESEIQADFGFLSQKGEVSETETSNAVKVLVLTEAVSNAIGYVVVDENVSRARTSVTQWLKLFGMESERYSIVLHTDAEQAVRNLITGSSAQFSFQVKKARNQQHQSIGGAERGVRRLRETLAVLRADLNQNGWDIRFDPDCIGEALNYLALMQNHFGRTRETDMSPLEVLAGRRLSKPTSALFGSTVLAELPTSLKQRAPNETRSVEASYLHCGLDKGPVVMGQVRMDGEIHLMQFNARNIRQITPISWNAQLCDSFLIPVALPVEQGDVVPPVADGERDDQPEPLGDPPGGDGDELNFDLPPTLEPAKGGQHPEVERMKQRKSPGEDSEPSNGRATKKVRFSDPPSAVAGGYIKTRGCPACESGMNAPGIRHSAVCRRTNQPVVVQQEDHQRDGDYSPSIAPKPEDMDIELEDVEIPQEAEFIERTKRTRSMDDEEIERNLKRERQDALVEDRGADISMGLFWEDTTEPVTTAYELSELSTLPATKPEVVIENLGSIRYDSDGAHRSEKVHLGGSDLLIWKPSEAIDDSTLGLVDPELTFEGMKEEVKNMEKCGAGTILNSEQVENLRKLKPQARLIASRWVVAKKTDVKIRARVVAKDLNRGVAARSLGYSSPTPSTEALNMVLSWAALKDWKVTSLDVSHAFMHSPLPSSETIILRLPQSISLPDGSPSFLLLKRALNGLRDASLHWLNLLSRTIRRTGVWSDTLEPCVYQGAVSKNSQMAGIVALVVYVDDILLVSSNKTSENILIEAISKAVPTKTTGAIFPSDSGGGSLTFIGRQISRRVGEKALFVTVDPDYLQPCFEDYGIKRGSSAAPDVASFLEKSDEMSKRLLTADGYAKFRKSLGKLLWLAQVRHDLKLWMSLIGSVQSKPTIGGDNALKAVLRFMFNDRHVHLRMPSNNEELTQEASGLVNRLNVWSDASHAPYRFNGRRGVSGEVIAYHNSVISAVAKQQQSVSLSSCEAELFAIQMAAQDSVALSRFVHRFLFGIGEIDEPDPVELFLETDSLSAIQLLEGVDIPRKSRHVEVRIMWLKAKMEEGVLKMQHRFGVGNCADLFTKCLGTRDFMRLRGYLGFQVLDEPLEALNMIAEENLIDQMMEKQFLAFAEICCLEKSCLNTVCSNLKVPYLGVSANMESGEVFQKFRSHVNVWKKQGKYVHVHVSTPCTVGSPLKHFNASSQDDHLEGEWNRIMSHAKQYLLLGDGRSFELPGFNSIWKREETQHVLEETGLKHGCEVFLCQTGLATKSNIPIGKTLVFRSSSFVFCSYLHKRFGKCNCDEHASLGDVVFKNAGNYTKKLAKGLIHGAVLTYRHETS